MKNQDNTVSTGMPALDDLLGGGLRRGELSCLADSVKSIDNGPVRECLHFTHFYRTAQRDTEKEATK